METLRTWVKLVFDRVKGIEVLFELKREVRKNWGFDKSWFYCIDQMEWCLNNAELTNCFLRLTNKRKITFFNYLANSHCFPTHLHQMLIPQLMLIIDGKESQKESRSFQKKWLSLTLLAQTLQPSQTQTAKVSLCKREKSITIMKPILHLYVKQALSRPLNSTALLNFEIISVNYHIVPVSQP